MNYLYVANTKLIPRLQSGNGQEKSLIIGSDRYRHWNIESTADINLVSSYITHRLHIISIDLLVEQPHSISDEEDLEGLWIALVE